MGIIQILNPDGTWSDYRPLSERLPAFLEAYPKNEGWQVRMSEREGLVVKPELVRLWQAAIEAGKNPAELGLPELPTNMFLFVAELVSPDGKVVETAAAWRPVVQYKDYEKGQTQARQRLLAACGFGGDMLDADEVSDIEEQGLSAQLPKPESKPKSKPKPEPESKPKPTQKSEPTRKPKPTPKPDPEPKPEPKPEASAKPAPPALVRQIAHQAKLRGVEVPVYTDFESAKAALKTVMASK